MAKSFPFREPIPVYDPFPVITDKTPKILPQPRSFFAVLSQDALSALLTLGLEHVPEPTKGLVQFEAIKKERENQMKSKRASFLNLRLTCKLACLKLLPLTKYTNPDDVAKDISSVIWCVPYNSVIFFRSDGNFEYFIKHSAYLPNCDIRWGKWGLSRDPLIPRINIKYYVEPEAYRVYNPKTMGGMGNGPKSEPTAEGKPASLNFEIPQYPAEFQVALMKEGGRPDGFVRQIVPISPNDGETFKDSSLKWRIDDSVTSRGGVKTAPISDRNSIVVELASYSQVARRIKCGVPDAAVIAENDPCCHQFVEEILGKMQREENSEISKKFTTDTMKKVSQEVAEDCMKGGMTDEEIRVALAEKLALLVV